MSKLTELGKAVGRLRQEVTDSLALDPRLVYGSVAGSGRDIYRGVDLASSPVDFSATTRLINSQPPRLNDRDWVTPWARLDAVRRGTEAHAWIEDYGELRRVGHGLVIYDEAHPVDIFQRWYDNRSCRFLADAIAWAAVKTAKCQNLAVAIEACVPTRKVIEVLDELEPAVAARVARRSSHVDRELLLDRYDYE